jgi:phosphoribosylamine--glycine ligase
MRLLVLGSGAREHALASRLAKDPGVSGIVCAPGNPGMARIADIAAVSLADPAAMLALAADCRADLTIVGPEAPLTLGVVDRFTAAGRRILGPTAAAARLESSKAFAKTFMMRRGIPTARFRIYDDRDEAIAAIRSGELGSAIVVKADGLAAGKGVVVAADAREAECAVDDMMRARRFGDAGARVVLEERMIGTEVSCFVLSDGARVVPIGTAQDHKRIFDDDRGPNTGGMGAFAPSPLVDAALEARIHETIARPVIAGMAEYGCPFRGFLYLGLMLTSEGPRVVEFNVRFGDPEAEVVLPLVGEPLLPRLLAAAEGRLDQSPVRMSTDKTAAVVIASRGYPESAERGTPIAGVDAAERVPGVQVFHAGTDVRDQRLVTAGGRVLTIVGRGADYAEAIARAYAAVLQISFDGMQYRSDIGRKALVMTSARETRR